MKKFFKGLGKGILYVVGFPFLIVGLCVAAVACFFIFLFQFGKFLFLFFTGRNLFSDLDEDIKAKDIITRNNLVQPVTAPTTESAQVQETVSQPEDYPIPEYAKENTDVKQELLDDSFLEEGKDDN